MANMHNTKKSSTGQHPTIDSKNTFEVPFDFISSQTIEGYPLEIPIQPTLDHLTLLHLIFQTKTLLQTKNFKLSLLKNLYTLFLKLKLINFVIILDHISSLLIKFL